MMQPRAARPDDSTNIMGADESPPTCGDALSAQSSCRPCPLSSVSVRFLAGHINCHRRKGMSLQRLSPHSRPLVLVIESDARVQRLVAQAIEQAGCTPIVAASE